MSKVRTFSRVFPSYHPRKGEPTYFIEKVWQSLYNMGKIDNCLGSPYLEKELEIFSNPSHFINAKWHTIRAGKHFKVGDYFSPRVWLDKPYISKQIAIAPDLQIKKIWDYEVKCPSKDVEQWFLNGTMVSESNEYMQQWFNANLIKEIAKNDGLELADFLSWFKHPSNFSGQILCWSESVEY